MESSKRGGEDVLKKTVERLKVSVETDVQRLSSREWYRGTSAFGQCTELAPYGVSYHGIHKRLSQVQILAVLISASDSVVKLNDFDIGFDDLVTHSSPILAACSALEIQVVSTS